ncbi:MAG TPA: tetratricopeptide repeat protein [Thermoanaerobaculaceae bacterium]|nr:tetratricopeptide repeat protein [Thermoanaerobaculaceae bacterium]
MPDRRAAPVLALAVAAVAVQAAGIDLPGTRTKWVTLRTEHLELLSDGSPSKVRDVALDLETMVSAVGQGTGIPIHLEPPAKVILFASATTFEEYCGALMGRSCTDTAGVFEPTEHASYLLLPVRRFEDARRVAYHELTHALVRNSMPSVPLWLDEGLAEFFGSFSTEGGEILIGRPDLEHLATLQTHGLLPTPAVLGATRDSPEYTSRSIRPQFYAQSWLMVHYLLAQAPAGRAHLIEFLTRRARGESDDQAFRNAFRTTPEQFNQELYAYAHRSVMASLRLLARSVAVKDPGAPAPLPRDAALAELGGMLLGCQRCDPQSARAFLDEAHRLNPESARNTATLAAVAARQGRAEEASRLFAEARGKAPDATASLLYGEYLLGLANEQARATGSPPEEMVLRARELFRGCLAADPGSVAALVGFGNTYLLAPREDPTPGIDAFERALASAPRRSDAASGLAQLCVRAGRPARANEVLAVYLADAPDPGARARLRELLARIEAENANAAASRGDLAGAAAALERALALASDPAFRSQLESRLARVQETAAYDAAVEDFNAGRRDQAFDALQRLIPTIADPNLRAEAERLRDHIATMKAAGTPDGTKEVVEEIPESPDSARARAERREAEARQEAERYNQAAALASRGDLVAALRIAEDLAANARSGEVRKAAAGLRDRIRARLAGRG